MQPARMGESRAEMREQAGHFTRTSFDSSVIFTCAVVFIAFTLACSFPAAAERNDSAPSASDSLDRATPQHDASDDSRALTQPSDEDRTENLFGPLIADIRWPHFSIAYHYYMDDDELSNVVATSFGETMPLLIGSSPFAGTWEVGIQAAVFAVFDIDTESKDLVNADYWVGFPFSYRHRNFSAILRIFHQSSHIGDEYLLRNRIDRINLSYESVDLKLSYDFKEWFRVYAGGGHIFRREPEDLKPWSTQFGFELRSPRTYIIKNPVLPVIGADFKSREETSWKTDVSLRSGIQFNKKLINNREYSLQIMLEYFNGYSPNGQFYERQINYLGLGTHFYF